MFNKQHHCDYLGEDVKLTRVGECLYEEEAHCDNYNCIYHPISQTSSSDYDYVPLDLRGLDDE